MKTVILDQKGEIVNNCDFEGKYKQVIAKLDDIDWAGATPVKINLILFECFINYRPLSLQEVKGFSEEELMDAVKYFVKLVSHINTYTTFSPDKQLFASFIGTTVDVYNQMLEEPMVQDIFKLVNGICISTNLQGAQSGSLKEKSTITKLQAKDDGFDIVKRDDYIQRVAEKMLDYSVIQAQLSKFNSMVKPQITNKPKK